MRQTALPLPAIRVSSPRSLLKPCHSPIKIMESVSSSPESKLAFVTASANNRKDATRLTLELKMQFSPPGPGTLTLGTQPVCCKESKAAASSMAACAADADGGLPAWDSKDKQQDGGHRPQATACSQLQREAAGTPDRPPHAEGGAVEGSH